MAPVRKINRRTIRVPISARRSTNREDSSPEGSPENRNRSSTPVIVSHDSIHSPYYLTNSDNPGISIVSEVFDGTNYDDWQIAIKIALDAKNKLAFIDGSVPRPLESDAMFRIWSRCNSMVKSWLLNSVSKQIYKSILRFNDASEIWNDLLTRYHITNLPRSYHLSQQIWSLQQGTMDLATYYTTLRTLWNELDSADCVTLCKRCDCCKAMEQRGEHARVIKFLAGLNESYAVIRSQIIMKKHVPSLAEIYNLLDHSQRSFTPVPSNAVAFNVSAPEPVQASINATYNVKPQKVICSHCGYTGHTVDKCYKIHGYPMGFKHKFKNQADKSSSTDKSAVPIKPVVAQLAMTDVSVTANDLITGLTRVLTKDQINGVVAYFNSQLQTAPSTASTSGATITALPGMAFSSSTIGFVGVLRATCTVLSSESWIIDSGATHHAESSKYQSVNKGLGI
ncbi:unnamed protein product [Arabidopsis arenosa]|uniref:Retrotransposon Copia-like N-terminal domain-containing protein n=1 Tax=Arabidopsis arenosa TaxID=38785 RepID=A0A8S2B2B2_ARAAE|nr:unnamed protein product [Arabidopsis arenosa]